MFIFPEVKDEEIISKCNLWYQCCPVIQINTSGVYHTDWNKPNPERQTLYVLLYIWELKYKKHILNNR